MLVSIMAKFVAAHMGNNGVAADEIASLLPTFLLRRQGQL
jgi:hypothetical protein